MSFWRFPREKSALAFVTTGVKRFYWQYYDALKLFIMAHSACKGVAMIKVGLNKGEHLPLSVLEK